MPAGHQTDTAEHPPDGPESGQSPLTRAATWWRRDARFDVAASLVVFLVAIPLSLGIAAASGAPIAAGLIAAAVGGIVAGLLGGSPLQVSGPAAGLVVVVAETIATFGWQATCFITAAAGVLQIVLGLSKVGRYALAISPTVVRAMLAGIGLSILLGQMNVALGSSSQPSAWSNLTHYPSALAEINLDALIAAVAIIVILMAWPRTPARVRVIPGPLVAVVAVTVIAAIWLPSAPRVDLGGSLLAQVGLPRMPDESLLVVVGAVITITLIASVESLLSAVAVDKLHGSIRSDLDRELFGQGAANSVSGLLGGLPITGVIVRSSTNVASGARTRASAILHGVWVLVFSLLLVGLVERIPLAALAGLLIVMGANLVKPADMREARRRGELWIYVITVAGVLALNLIEGVMIGLVGALAIILWRMAHLRATVEQRGVTPEGRQLWCVDIVGSLSFLATPKLVAALNEVPAGHHAEVDLVVDYVDAASEEQLQMWQSSYERAGGTVQINRPGAPAPEARPAKLDPRTDRAWKPWGSWQNSPRRDSLAATSLLAAGIREYHRRATPELEEAYAELAGGQTPRAFFLTCADSRVVPNLMTSSGPGDLFTVRTMGNFVPRGSDDISVEAPLQFALDALRVPAAVVCGHSGCGAMQGALDRDAMDLNDPVRRWLTHADEALAAWRSGHPVGRAAAEAGLSEADQLSQVNVALSVERLCELVGDRPGVECIGLWLKIDDGTVWILRDDHFVPLTDAERLELSPQLLH